MPFGILFILPLGLRVILGAVLPSDRSYDDLSMAALFFDPSALAFGVSGCIVCLTLLKDASAASPLFHPPLVYFFGYAVVGGSFSLFTGQWLLGALVLVELVIYLAIASICISASTAREDLPGIIEGSMYAFFTLLLFVAVVDLILPWTQPFSETAAGIKRFDGDLLPLIAIQWGAISAITLIISTGHFLRDGRAALLHSCAALAAGGVLLASGTRGALIGCILGMLVYAVNASRAALVRSAVTIFLVAVPVMAIGTFAGADRLLSQAAHQARLEDLDNVEKLGGRTLFWDNVVGVLLANPVFGQGIGLRTRESGISSSTHNAFLEAWVGAGIFGALLFTLGVVSTGARLISIIRWSRTRLSAERDNSYRVATTALAVLVYLVVHGLTESGAAGVNNFMSVPLLYCAIVSGQLYAAAVKASSRTSQPSETC